MKINFLIQSLEIITTINSITLKNTARVKLGKGNQFQKGSYSNEIVKYEILDNAQ